MGMGKQTVKEGSEGWILDRWSKHNDEMFGERIAMDGSDGCNPSK